MQEPLGATRLACKLERTYATLLNVVLVCVYAVADDGAGWPTTERRSRAVAAKFMRPLDNMSSLWSHIVMFIEQLRRSDANDANER